MSVLAPPLCLRDPSADATLSLDLIRGSLDQVDSTVDIKWVQPRVLDKSQLETLARQFEQWSEGVGQTEAAVDVQRRSAQKGSQQVAAVQ